jgi:C4-dicarboxylate transporter
MKSFNFGNLLLAVGLGLLAWAAYDYFAHPIIDASNCGVTVSPASGPVIVTAFAESRVPLKLVNRSGRPVRIVGNNAC